MTCAVITFDQFQMRRAAKLTGQKPATVIPICTPDIEPKQVFVSVRARGVIYEFRIGDWVRTVSGGIGMIRKVGRRDGQMMAELIAGSGITSVHPLDSLQPNMPGGAA